VAPRLSLRPRLPDAALVAVALASVAAIAA